VKLYVNPDEFCQIKSLEYECSIGEEFNESHWVIGLRKIIGASTVDRMMCQSKIEIVVPEWEEDNKARKYAKLIIEHGSLDAKEVIEFKQAHSNEVTLAEKLKFVEEIYRRLK
jgi:hypothetical protein